jgi:branched-chain amino acid transport system ATP-binding protein
VSAGLQTTGLTVRYGGVKALTDVSLEVADGQLVGLIGPNGAGKTTLIDAITGFAPATGSVRLGGQDLTGHPAHERARRGLSRTWQAAELFGDLTVRENLAVAAHRPGAWASAREILTRRAPRREGVDRALEQAGLGELADVLPQELTQGQRKLAGVGRALAARARVVCLDEPAAGLDSDESLELGRRLRAIVDGGTGMLLVDHDMGLVLTVCDHVVVLEFGEVIAAGPPDAIRTDPRVIEAYLGSAAEEVVGTARAGAGARGHRPGVVE